MAIKDNRRNSAAVQPVSAGGAGAETEAFPRNGLPAFPAAMGKRPNLPAAESWAFGRWPAWLSVQ